MQRFRTLPLLAVALAMPDPALAEGRFDHWKTGDLIFQDSSSAQAAAIRVATGSRYTHMGIVLQTASGPRVIEAGRTVVETPLRDFIARGVGRDYSVYRARGLTEQGAEAVVAAAREYSGRPYDIFFRLDPAAIYCSELPFYAFQAAGIVLGEVERLGDLAIGSPEGRAVFLARWQGHPDCRAGGADRDACWALIQQQAIVTPVSIAEDPGLEPVFSTFGPAQ